MEKESEIQALVLYLENTKKKYYEEGDSYLRDEDFDLLEDKLRSLVPNHPYFEQVGTSVTRGSEIEHKVPMLSCEKCKNFGELLKWVERLSLPFGTEFLIEPKIDGISASCVYKKGRLTSISTRGDGKMGKDITFVAQYIKTIPFNLPCFVNLEVRGELYLPQDTSFDTGGRPLRNNCSGLVNRKDRHEDLHYVFFTAYQILGDMLSKESDSLTYLKDLGFNVVCFKSVNTAEEIDEYYTLYLREFRYNWYYETDGLMIKVNDRKYHSVLDSRWVVRHHHHYLIAFKPPAQSCQTYLKNIEWQVSRNGNLIPMAIFDPIRIGGAVISRASLHNATMVKKLCLCERDIILVERSNDVIPSVKANLSQKENDYDKFLVLIPNQCPVCHFLLEWCGVHLVCPNRFCSERRIQKILYWVTSCKMRNIAEATIRLLYKNQLLKKIVDLYQISAIDLEPLANFGPKKVKNFLQEVSKSRCMTMIQFIARLGIPQLQELSLEKLKIETLEDFWDFSDPKHVIGKNLIAWREDDDNRNFVKELAQVLYLEHAHFSKRGKVCLTGNGPLSRNEIVKKVENKGFHVVNMVSKDVVFLVCDGLRSDSKKLVRAKDLDVKVISYEEFFRNESISVNS